MKTQIISKQELKSKGARESGNYMFLEQGSHIHFYKKEGRDYYLFQDTYHIKFVENENQLEKKC